MITKEESRYVTSLVDQDTKAHGCSDVSGLLNKREIEQKVQHSVKKGERKELFHEQKFVV